MRPVCLPGQFVSQVILLGGLDLECEVSKRGRLASGGYSGSPAEN